MLLAKHAIATRPRHAKHAPSAHPDALCDALRDVPRWVFALLRGPLLSSHTPLSPHRVSVDGARPPLRTSTPCLHPLPTRCTARASLAAGQPALPGTGRIALLALYASLPPRCLLTALYPRLYAYASAEQRPASPLALSWAEVRRPRGE